MSDQAQARCRPRSAAVTGWSFLVVVSCGRSTNDHLRVPECRTVSGFRGRAETATTYPQFIPFDSAVRPTWAAAIAPALLTGAAGAPAHAGTPDVLPRACGVAVAGNAPGSGSSQERLATSRPLISTESRATRCGRSEPPAGSAPGSLVPAPLGSTRRCRRPARRRRSLSTTARAVAAAGDVPSAGRRRPAAPLLARWSSRFIGRGGGAGTASGPGRRARVSDLRLAGINGSMDDPDAGDDQGEEVVSW